MKYHSSWIDFLNKIELAIKKLKFEKNEEIFYRGHTNTSHTLTPGIFRNFERLKDKNVLWENESDMFYEFRSKARDIHHNNLTDWDILFFMQHHGVKTRLLDWTESFSVAIYFALLDYDENSSNNPCIWLLNPYKLNEEYHGFRDMYDPENLGTYNSTKSQKYSKLLLFENDAIPWKIPVAVYPVRKVERLTVQGGYFTIHGTDKRPIEKIIPSTKNIWAKIEVPKEAVESAKYFLEQAGINHFKMFPDLDGLSKYLNNKYF